MKKQAGVSLHDRVAKTVVPPLKQEGWQESRVESKKCDLPAKKIKKRNFSKEEVSANLPVLHKDFDAGYAYSITEKILQFVNRIYFRTEFVGFDNLPKRNNKDYPLIYVSNHSGMAFPWDAISFTSALYQKTGYDLPNATRALTSPALSRAYFMSPFLLENFWKKLGAIDASTLNFETSMLCDSNILIYPEGVPGIGKGFNNKYQLQRLATSALRMSIKYKTDIIPFATVNGEYINPFSYSLKKLNEWVNKFDLPFLPLGPSTLLIPLQPWLFYFAFPAKLIFVRGKRLKPYEMVGNRPLEEVSESEIQQLRDTLQVQMQQDLEQAVKVYGKSPYRFAEFFRMATKNIKHILKFCPLFWALIFTDHFRKFSELRKKLESRGEYSSNHNQQIGVMQQQHKTTFKYNVRISSLFRAVWKTPQVLLLFTPIIGLFTMFGGKKKK